MTEIPELTNVTIALGRHVADIRLNRPDKSNALSLGLMEDIIKAANWASERPEVRCVVLSGVGRTFCAGMDMENFKNTGSGPFTDIIERTHGNSNFFQQVAWGWRECRVPVIAAIHGAALGGGFQVALGADIRIVHPKSKMSIMEMKWGLIPDMAGTALMCHLASEDIIRELTYTARVFDGQKAKEYGFATHVSETPFEDAMALALEIAGNNPDAIIASKKLFNGLADFQADEILMRESALQADVVMGTNQLEAIKAGFEKRRPVFKDAS